MPLSCQRHLFDLPEEIVYMNCAYFGPFTHRVVEAAKSGLERRTRPWEIEADDFFDPVEEARIPFGRLVGGDPDGVALIPSVSYGIAVAANNLALDPSDEIVVLAEQFPSNIYAWRELEARIGARLRTVERPEDHDWTTAILEAIGPRTAVVAIPHCHWTDGGLIDLVTMARRVRDVGAALVVDGCQSVGALPFDVAEIQPDFLVTGTYKWLLGPYSHGFLWTAPKHRQGRPIELNWNTRSNRRDFAGLVSYSDEFATGARRFDMGGVSNFALLPAAIAALEQILDWGVEEIQSYTRRLTDFMADEAQKLGLEVVPRDLRAGHIVGIRLGGRDPRRVASALASARIYVSVRGDSVRVSPHVHNDQRDAERLIEVLAEVAR